VQKTINDKKLRFFKTAQVADMLNVHQSTVNRWINTGELRAFTTPGGHRRITRADLIAFLRNNGLEENI